MPGGGRSWRLPPDLPTLGRLLLHGPALLRLVAGVRSQRHADLGTLLERQVRSSEVEALVCTLAYASGLPPRAIRTSDLAAELQPEWGYHHDRQLVPRGGAQALIDGLVDAFLDRGGRLYLDTDVQRVDRHGDRRRVVTARGTWQAHHVVTSQSHPKRRDRRLRRGLAASQLLFAVPRSLALFKERALVVLPPAPSRWLSALDRGEQPEAFGFHVFKDEPLVKSPSAERSP